MAVEVVKVAPIRRVAEIACELSLVLRKRFAKIAGIRWFGSSRGVRDGAPKD